MTVCYMTWQVEAVMAEREGDEAQGEEGGRGRTDRRVASGECEAAAVRDVSACGDERGLRVADVVCAIANKWRQPTKTTTPPHAFTRNPAVESAQDGTRAIMGDPEESKKKVSRAVRFLQHRCAQDRTGQTVMADAYGSGGRCQIRRWAAHARRRPTRGR